MQLPCSVSVQNRLLIQSSMVSELFLSEKLLYWEWRLRIKQSILQSIFQVPHKDRFLL